MRPRLPRWLRREPAPQGRHVRRPAPVSAPGAGAALVAGAAEPYLLATDATAPTEDGAWRTSLPPVELRPTEQEPVTAGDDGPATEPVPTVLQPSAPDAVPAALVAAPAAPSPADGVPVAEGLPADEGVVSAEHTVALGFADGRVLELAPDDPRLPGFQDAAAAVLARPPA